MLERDRLERGEGMCFQCYGQCCTGERRRQVHPADLSSNSADTYGSWQQRRNSDSARLGKGGAAKKKNKEGAVGGD